MSGVWIEQDENGRDVKIVKTQPERGVQLAGDGQEITPDVQARIDSATEALKVRGGPDPQPITSESARGKK